MSQSPLLPVKIFVLGNGSLLDEGICSMLTLHSQLNITRIAYTDDDTLSGLKNLEYPCTVFINEFDLLNVTRAIKVAFSAPPTFFRRVIVAHIENSMVDVYYRSITHVPAMAYQRVSVMVNSKEELFDLVRNEFCFA